MSLMARGGLAVGHNRSWVDGLRASGGRSTDPDGCGIECEVPVRYGSSIVSGVVSCNQLHREINGSGSPVEGCYDLPWC